MSSGFKKSTNFFAEESAKAKERQDKIVESVEAKPKAKKASKATSSTEDKLVQLSIYVPESYRKRARMAALKEDRSVSDAVREFLDGWFNEVGV